MTPATNRPHSASRPGASIRRRGLTEEELTLYRLRRRLLRYILENHRRRIAERGLCGQPARQPA